MGFLPYPYIPQLGLIGGTHFFFLGKYMRFRGKNYTAFLSQGISLFSYIFTELGHFLAKSLDINLYDLIHKNSIIPLIYIMIRNLG